MLDRRSGWHRTLWKSIHCDVYIVNRQFLKKLETVGFFLYNSERNRLNSQMMRKIVKGLEEGGNKKENEYAKKSE